MQRIYADFVLSTMSNRLVYGEKSEFSFAREMYIDP